jgi:hypothetical protein
LENPAGDTIPAYVFFEMNSGNPFLNDTISITNSTIQNDANTHRPAYFIDLYGHLVLSNIGFDDNGGGPVSAVVNIGETSDTVYSSGLTQGDNGNGPGVTNLYAGRPVQYGIQDYNTTSTLTNLQVTGSLADANGNPFSTSTTNVKSAPCVATNATGTFVLGSCLTNPSVTANTPITWNASNTIGFNTSTPLTLGSLYTFTNGISISTTTASGTISYQLYVDSSGLLHIGVVGNTPGSGASSTQEYNIPIFDCPSNASTSFQAECTISQSLNVPGGGRNFIDHTIEHYSGFDGWGEFYTATGPGSSMYPYFVEFTDASGTHAQPLSIAAVNSSTNSAGFNIAINNLGGETDMTGFLFQSGQFLQSGGPATLATTTANGSLTAAKGFTSNQTSTLLGVTVASGTQYYSAFASSTANTSATTINWNNSNVQEIKLTTSTTFTFSNANAGARYLLMLLQDASGTRTVTWPASIQWPSGTVPTLTATANKMDIVSLVCGGVSSTDCYGGTNLNYSP